MFLRKSEVMQEKQGRERIAFLQTWDKNDERNFMDYQIEQFTYG